MRKQHLSLLAFLFVGTATANSRLRFIPKSEFPNEQWISLDPSTEFHPASTNTLTNSATVTALDMASRHLSSSSSSTTSESSTSSGSSSSSGSTIPYETQPFVEGVSDYSSYQQAWRLLGFMIDCDVINTGEGGSGDKNKNGNGNQPTGEGCQRYVVWAAYVDLQYEGGGIGEYQYWDRETNQWDTTPCNYSKQNGNKNNNNKNNNNNNNNDNNANANRCAKMDCHLPDTHWSLLGFFKHKSYSDWFGQLFKHEGMCIWSSDEYSFMKNARKSWPQGCSMTDSVTSTDQPIYYDLKPTSGGMITVGLYTDTRCVQEYQSQGSHDTITAENVVGNILLNNRGGKSRDNNNNNNNNAESNYTLTEALTMWDSAFDAFTICQPCVAYDLDNVGYNTNDDVSKGSAYNTYRYGYDDYAYQYYYSNKGADFDCYDDAGYTNVNQCMKFMAKTTMYTATFRDLALATTQGTLVDNPVTRSADYSAVSKSTASTKVQRAAEAFVTCCFFIVSSAVLAGGMFVFAKARKELRENKSPPEFILDHPATLS